MTGIRPEFCRLIPIGRIGAGGLEQVIEADAAECRALAARLGVPAVASLRCRALLQAPVQGVVAVEAELRAELTRICVVTMDAFETAVHDHFSLRFVREDMLRDEIDPEAPDELPYAGQQIDLGEAAAEQLALVLDPYPRMPGTVLPTDGDPDDGADTSAPEHPFAALRRLRASDA